MPTSDMAGRKRNKPKAIQQNVAMVTLGVSYVRKYSSAMGIYAKHAKPKDASRQPPTLTTSSTRQAVARTMMTTSNRSVRHVTKPKHKPNLRQGQGWGKSSEGEPLVTVPLPKFLRPRN